MERVKHTIIANKANLATGENVFACTDCGDKLTLVWDGETFTLREVDQADLNFGEVAINWEEGRAKRVDRRSI